MGKAKIGLIGFFAWLVLFPVNFASADKTNEALNTLNGLIDTLTISININPIVQDNKEKCGLRSVLLFTSSTLMIEPPSLCPNGEHFSAAAQVTQKEASGIIALLVETNFFEQAEKYYSERTPTAAEASTPPADALDIRNKKSDVKLNIKSSGYIIQLNVFDTNWYTYYENSFEWTKESKELLLKIQRELEGEAQKQIAMLLKEIE